MRADEIDKMMAYLFNLMIILYRKKNREYYSICSAAQKWVYNHDRDRNKAKSSFSSYKKIINYFWKANIFFSIYLVGKIASF